MAAAPTTAVFEAARTAREHAHSPYSRHKVGAAIRLGSGEVFSGCNVENSSYGATCCAERVAIHSAVASQGRVELREVVVVTDASPPWPPCGICRQVIAEFAPRDGSLTVHCMNLRGEVQSFAFSDLLPRAFTPDHLPRPS